MTKNNKSKDLIIIIFGIIIVVLIAGFTWLLINYRNLNQQSQNESMMQEEELQELLDKVSKHILLPQDENPMIATIMDVDSLVAQQDFYLNAKNGDKLIIYSSKAIIYSPEKDILINVGPVVLDPPSETIEGDQVEVQ